MGMIDQLSAALANNNRNTARLRAELAAKNAEHFAAHQVTLETIRHCERQLAAKDARIAELEAEALEYSNAARKEHYATIARAEKAEADCAEWMRKAHALAIELNAAHQRRIAAQERLNRTAIALEELADAAERDLKHNQDDKCGCWSFRTENAIREARGVLDKARSALAPSPAGREG